jgi:hypothetical protein
MLGMAWSGRLAILAVAAGWLVFTFDWIRRLGSYPHKAGMYRALKLWALADAVAVATFAFLVPAAS